MRAVLSARENDVALVVQAEAWVVRDLPRMPIEIPKRAGVPSVERVSGLARDLGAVLTSLFDHGVYLFLRVDVLSQGDTAPACTVVRNAEIRAELLPPPQGEGASV